MLKKTITFEDLEGNKLTEDFYFHLTKADIAEMELSEKGGLTDHVKKIIAAEDGPQLVALMKDLLVKTVGHRSEDGRRFIKNQAIIDDFVQSDAYSELFVELATNAESAAAFIRGVVPASMQEAVDTGMSENVELPAVSDSATPAPAPQAEVVEPAWLTEGRTPTPDEVKNATPEQLRLAFQRKQAQPPPVA